MPIKQKKSLPKTKHIKGYSLIGDSKKAIDGNAHLEFSITKNSKSHEYKPVPRHDYKKSIIQTTNILDQINEFDKKIESLGSKVIKKTDNVLNVKVNTKPHKSSPYVVRLLGEWESAKPNKSRQSKQDENAQEGEWIKEVERLRKDAAIAYKKKSNFISINLLGSTSSKSSKKQPLSISSIPRKFGKFLLQFILAISNWIFEFVLSIPLGFLLALEVLLWAVERINRVAIKFGQLLGKSVSFLIQNIIYVIVALLKAIIVIPIKIVSLAFLGMYRIISSGSSALLWIGNAIFETLKNYFSILIYPKNSVYRKMIILTIVAGAIMLPIKFLSIAPESIRILEGSVLGATKQGFLSIASVGEGFSKGQADTASGNLIQAKQQFSTARESIDSLNIVVRGLVNVLPKGQDGIHAIAAGESLTNVGVYLTQALAPLLNGTQQERTNIEMLTNIKRSLVQAKPHISNAKEHLLAINPNSLPDAYKVQFERSRKLLPSIEDAIVDATSLINTLATVLGSNSTKRYAVLFQNNNELRPSGGFIGSLAFIDVHNGAIEDIEIPTGGSYDFQGFLTEHIKAPKPLQLINPRWEMQDANWYPDWPTSAEKIAWFIEKSGHSSVDGVIAIQATSFVKLLELLGPITFEQEGEEPVVLTSKNVLQEIQREVELDYDKQENEPKKYIAELAPKVLEKILSGNASKQLSMLSLVKSEIQQKNILLYFRDKEVNQSFLDRGWEPSIVSTDLDYLSIIHANIGGGKTDGVIKEKWDEEIVIDKDGNVVVNLTIVREHRGDTNHVFEGYNNVDYVRVYTPLGSELISFEGVKPPPVSMFEQPEDYYNEDYELSQIEGKVIIDEKTSTRITNEFGKTVFGNWLQVDPGNILVTKLSYKLPFEIKPFDLLNPKVKSGYSLLIQKQAGARTIPYTISLKYPSTWQVTWQKTVGDGEVSVLGPGLTVFEGDLEKDTGFSVLFGD